ncbi:phosphotransferase family protein [Geodermatophilus sp. SYSU D00691]
MTPDDLAAELGTPVEGLTRLSGGASRETWALTAGGRALVLRSGAGTGGVDLAVEAQAMTAAARAGVPVPEVVRTGELDGRPYLLMAHVDGETIPRRVLRDPAVARPGLAAELGGLLARLHSVPLAEVPDVAPTGDPLEELRTAYLADGRVPPPGLALGLRRLAAARPVPAGEVLVHGDFRMGNLMLGPDGVRAVLDWELVHRGDPVADLGWLCAKVWRFGSPRPAGGVGSRAELLDGYAAIAGWRPTEAQLHWWELYGTVRWGLMTGVMADRHLSGAEPSVELAAIGRRAAEQEFDVLLALGLDAPDASLPAEPAADDPELFGRPTAAELVEAVAHFLAADVQPGTEGRVAFHARVAGNVLATVRRELLLGPAARAAHRARLDRLGCADDEALARGIGDRSLDDGDPAVLDAVRGGVRGRLRVANPRHLTAPA